MDITREELQSRMERFEEALRSSGIKLTHQRIEIFREVAKTGDHPDAEKIYKRVKKRIPTISLDTVYRTLWMLNDMGLITTLGLQRGRVRFDANVSPHHHFVCARCGRVGDFYSQDFDDLEVPEAVRSMGDVATIHVQFRGLCSRCSENNRRK
jgi:Fur family transcriptional regulator, peroxide stress response regulator